jgi:ferritin-like metal-binding protein YciE
VRLLSAIDVELSRRTFTPNFRVAAQAVEHYEMTRHGTLIAWAKKLGRNDAATLLSQTLEEEKATDKKLTQMAEASINQRAA